MRKEIEAALEKTKEVFGDLDKTAIYNQKKVLQAFSDNRIALRHFCGTSGYGNDDLGRDSLGNVIAQIFGAEKCIASPLIASGTHALSLVLFGLLRPGDVVLSVTGEPYDTMQDVIYKKGIGSLADMKVRFSSVSLANGRFDFDAIKEFLKKNDVSMIYIQRSRGYNWRLALSIEEIRTVCDFVREQGFSGTIFCDNCYGEFVEDREPTQVGVDVCAGSFIKNIGGGLAPTGGYVVGRKELVDCVSGRLTAPSIGCEVGSYAYGYRLFYQGLFMAPHTVNQALKVALLFSSVLSNLGYDVLPKVGDKLGDIVCSVKLGDPEKMIAFCKAVQSVSPIDGYVSPEPWIQPGYSDKVIMAAGCFVQGSSIELSCDGPIREPYTVYLQGGLTLEHGLIALESVLDSLLK